MLRRKPRSNYRQNFDAVDWIEVIEDMDGPLQLIREVRLVSW